MGNRETNPLSIINPSLEIVYYSTTLSNHGIRALSIQTLWKNPESLITLPHMQIVDVANNLMMREGRKLRNQV
jgi:hypothetical protein